MGVVLSIDYRTHSQADKILRNIYCEKNYYHLRQKYLT